MLMYDQGVVKIQKMGKQIYFASTMSMDLKHSDSRPASL